MFYLFIYLIATQTLWFFTSTQANYFWNCVVDLHRCHTICRSSVSCFFSVWTHRNVNIFSLYVWWRHLVLESQTWNKTASKIFCNFYLSVKFTLSFIKRLVYVVQYIHGFSIVFIMFSLCVSNFTCLWRGTHCKMAIFNQDFCHLFISWIRSIYFNHMRHL